MIKEENKYVLRRIILIKLYNTYIFIYVYRFVFNLRSGFFKYCHMLSLQINCNVLQIQLRNIHYYCLNYIAM